MKEFKRGPDGKPVFPMRTKEEQQTLDAYYKWQQECFENLTKNHPTLMSLFSDADLKGLEDGFLSIVDVGYVLNNGLDPVFGKEPFKETA